MGRSYLIIIMARCLLILCFQSGLDLGSWRVFVADFFSILIILSEIQKNSSFSSLPIGQFWIIEQPLMLVKFKGRWRNYILHLAWFTKYTALLGIYLKGCFFTIFFGFGKLDSFHGGFPFVGLIGISEELFFFCFFNLWLQWWRLGS